MLIEKKITVYVSRKSVTVPETLYSEGFDVESNGDSLEFFLDFSTNLHDSDEARQKEGAKSLEEDLKNSRNPTVLEANLDTKESFDAAHKSIDDLISLHKLEQPVKSFLNLKISDSYRLGCEVKVSEEYNQIRFNITE